MKWKAMIAVLVLLFSILGLLYSANRYVNDETIPTRELGVTGDRVLMVVAHPDDEIAAAGTLASLDSRSIQTGVVYLTRGEEGPTAGLVPKERLGEERTREIHSVKQILGIDYIRIFDFPDMGIKDIPADKIKNAMLKCLDEFRPTVVIGHDETVGLYGSEDHRLAGLYLHQLLDQSNLAYVKKHYMVTLPQPMIRLALKMSEFVFDGYPRDPKKGLPTPHIAVPIWRYHAFKKKALQAHKTQVKLLKDVQPYGMTIPSIIYYRVLDREYFHEVELKHTALP